MASNETNLYCPDCGKRKRYENRQKKVYYCFVCGSGGRIRNGDKVSGSIIDPDKEPRNKILSIPPERSRLTDFDRRYFKNRGVSDEVINHERERIWSTAHGILFEFPTENYWQERRWSAFRPPAWACPKESPRTSKDGVGYHLRVKEGADSVVVVEGIFDALRVTSVLVCNSFAILSKRVHDLQALELARYYNRCSFILDSDASIRDFNMGVSALAAHIDVDGILLTEGDPAEQTEEALRELLG